MLCFMIRKMMTQDFGVSHLHRQGVAIFLRLNDTLTTLRLPCLVSERDMSGWIFKQLSLIHFVGKICGKMLTKRRTLHHSFHESLLSNIATHSNSTCSPGSRCPWHVVGLRAKGLELIEASKSCETPSSNVQVSVWKTSWAIEMQKKLMNHWKK